MSAAQREQLIYLAEKLPDPRVAMTAELREQLMRALVVVARIEQLGRVRARVLDRREERVRIDDGAHHYELALLMIDGESAPRWVSAERIVDPNDMETE